MRPRLRVIGYVLALSLLPAAAGHDEAGPAPVLPTLPMARAAIETAASGLVENTALAIASSARLRGTSGRVQAVVLHPGETLPLAFDIAPALRLQFVAADQAAPADTVDGVPTTAGAWHVIVRLGDTMRRITDLHVFTSVPLTDKRSGRIGEYRLGTWPFETKGQPASRAYAPPAGLVEVTPANADLPVSAHLRLRDFLTKGQADVWPKYVALNPRVLDKIELTIGELERSGVAASSIGVISAFRTPFYNANGGNPAGRGDLSRHMYGDAVDLFIDNDGDGAMDDLNGDGRIDVRDARVLAEAADRVELQHPHLVGGIGVYTPRPGAHRGFVHIDARGGKARW